MTITSRTLAAAVVAAGAAFATAGAAVVPATAATRSCSESIKFIESVKASNTSCRSAVTLANRWTRTDSCFEGGGDTPANIITPCTVRGYRCTPKRAGNNFRVAITCKKSTARVRFISAQ